MRMISRRRFATGACVVLVGAGSAGQRGRARAADGFADALAGDIAKIEVESGGRLGVAVLDTLTDARFGQRADERFPMCSTFKLVAAAAILARVDAGEERLDRRIRFGAGEVVVNSPITKDLFRKPVPPRIKSGACFFGIMLYPHAAFRSAQPIPHGTCSRRSTRRHPLQRPMCDPPRRWVERSETNDG
jgi:beta-lactamase family protein